MRKRKSEVRESRGEQKKRDTANSKGGSNERGGPSKWR